MNKQAKSVFAAVTSRRGFPVFGAQAETETVGGYTWTEMV